MKNQQSDSIISYLAAIAPALLQLIAVLSVGLVNVLRLEQFVLAPTFINFANFLVVLLSISLISLSSFWDYNKFTLLNEGENVFSQTKNFWKVLKIFEIISVIASIIFMGVILNKSDIKSDINFWAFTQWSAYVIAMVSLSFIIYTFALLKIQERKYKSLYENYIPRLIDSLRRYGHVSDPDIVIDKVDRETRQAEVRLGSKDKYKVTTDFTGDMVSIEKLS